MKLAVCAVITLMAGSVNAQQIMDGSDKTIDEKMKSAIFAAFISAAADPFSAQIIGLKPAKDRPELICGMVNLKNTFGSYTGFQPFAFNAQYNNLLLQQNLSDCM